MANTSNDIKINRMDRYPVVEALKKCRHGTVFDEIRLILPGEPEYLFSRIEYEQVSANNNVKSINMPNLTELFMRFSSEN